MQRDRTDTSVDAAVASHSKTKEERSIHTHVVCTDFIQSQTRNGRLSSPSSLILQEPPVYKTGECGLSNGVMFSNLVWIHTRELWSLPSNATDAVGVSVWGRERCVKLW